MLLFISTVAHDFPAHHFEVTCSSSIFLFPLYFDLLLDWIVLKTCFLFTPNCRNNIIENTKYKIEKPLCYTTYLFVVSTVLEVNKLPSFRIPYEIVNLYVKNNGKNIFVLLLKLL